MKVAKLENTRVFESNGVNASQQRDENIRETVDRSAKDAKKSMSSKSVLVIGDKLVKQLKGRILQQLPKTKRPSGRSSMSQTGCQDNIASSRGIPERKPATSSHHTALWVR